MLRRRCSFYISWIMIFTDEELKEMKKLLIIAPWTELYLSGDEKIRNEEERRNEKK